MPTSDYTESGGQLDCTELPSGWEASKEDFQRVEALLSGDEVAFVALLEQYQRPLLRLALSVVANHAVAEEVVQQTWVGVIEGLGRFHGRSSLKTWIFRILVNQAKTHAGREARSLPISEFDPQEDGHSPVDPSRFQKSGAWQGHWTFPPPYWEDQTPERLILSKESRLFVEEAIDKLPPSQRHAILLRDVEGLTSKEVCQILNISENYQRVLLHRARAGVRSTLEQYLKGG
ncbi:MAG: sigma-70 family RNA polymerase sigma factor, partial [Nitrospirota bacterium]|nr:sigma-70 family RNA polymerase sigma factor [Nitrospirota bacterium]